MQFETKKDDFLKVLQTVQNAISLKNTLPILANLLIEAASGDITITATDLDMGISSKMKTTPIMQGAVTIPAKKLLDIIKELPEQDVCVAAKKNNIVFIDCGNAHFKVVGLPKEEFPQVAEIKDREVVKVPQKMLKNMLLLTHFAVSKDEARYVLNGVLFLVKDKTIRLVATDGRRLAIMEKELPEKAAAEKKAIIPAKTASELVRVLGDGGDVSIIFGQNQALFEVGATKITSRLVDGEFPNYEQVIPKRVKDKIKVNRVNFLDAAKRASIFTNHESLAVKLNISKNKMTISKNASYIGEVREDLDIVYDGGDLSVGFNPAYIIEPLKNLEQEEIEFEIESPDKPGAFRIGNEYTYVVLPMQLT